MLIVADPPRVDDIAVMFDEPLPFGFTEILRSTGGDDTIDLAASRRPYVCVITASLEGGDAAALIDALRGMIPRAEVAIVLIGDAEGPMRTALDALELAPDRFVSSPVVPKALRFAVGGVLEAVALARGTAPAKPDPSAAPELLPDVDPTHSQRAAQRVRWEALANSFVEIVEEEEMRPDPGEDAEPLPPPDPPGRRHSDSQSPTSVPAPLEVWQPGTTSELREKVDSHVWSAPEPPVREPTLIIRDPEPSGMSDPAIAVPPPLPAPEPAAPDLERTSGRETDPWAGALPLAQLIGGEARPKPIHDDVGLDDFEDDLVLGHETSRRKISEPRLEVIDSLPDEPLTALPSVIAGNAAQDGRDFARQLRAKMSMMAQRLFQGGDAASSPAVAVDVGPRHDHHTEIDLTSLGEEPALERGNTEIEARSSSRSGEIRDLTTSPGSWDTQIRERGLPDTGEIARGVSDAAMLLAKMFAQASTGRIAFRLEGLGAVEKVVFFDQGRPVFASSSEPRDRMGELLVREGKITAAQYERCQTVVAESGRRMGEILVDFGYLKRRELLPAVRRHVEDIVYSLFQWDRGTYHIALDATPSSERIRLSRHPAALILEGIRRKLDRTSLERLIGAASTVIEVPDRERLGGIINLGDLAVEERSALAAFDASADLSAVARAAGVDVADVLPLAWGLCVLGLATARRTDTEVPDESSALVGETDLAIDRERVRARWELVGEADYFALLGVRRDATGFEIRRAYQSARRDFATDSFPNDLRRELAQELDDIAHVLDEAFRVLRDDRLRMTYLSNLVG